MSFLAKIHSIEPYTSYGIWKDCPTVYEIFSYVGIEGKLSTHRKSQVDLHLENGCPDCREAIDELTRLHEKVQENPVPPDVIDEYVAQLRSSVRL